MGIPWNIVVQTITSLFQKKRLLVAGSWRSIACCRLQVGAVGWSVPDEESRDVERRVSTSTSISELTILVIIWSFHSRLCDDSLVSSVSSVGVRWFSYYSRSCDDSLVVSVGVRWFLQMSGFSSRTVHRACFGHVIIASYVWWPLSTRFSWVYV